MHLCALSITINLQWYWTWLTCGTVHHMCIKVTLCWRHFSSQSQTNNSQKTCLDITARSGAAYYLRLMNLSCLRLAGAVCGGSFFIRHVGTLWFKGHRPISAEVEERRLVRGKNKKACLTVVLLIRPALFFCFLRPCQPATDPSPSADLSPSDTLSGALWCDVCSHVQ